MFESNYIQKFHLIINLSKDLEKYNNFHFTKGKPKTPSNIKTKKFSKNRPNYLLHPILQEIMWEWQLGSDVNITITFGYTVNGQQTGRGTTVVRGKDWAYGLGGRHGMEQAGSEVSRRGQTSSVQFQSGAHSVDESRTLAPSSLLFVVVALLVVLVRVRVLLVSLVRLKWDRNHCLELAAR